MTDCPLSSDDHDDPPRRPIPRPRITVMDRLGRIRPHLSRIWDWLTTIDYGEVVFSVVVFACIYFFVALLHQNVKPFAPQVVYVTDTNADLVVKVLDLQKENGKLLELAKEQDKLIDVMGRLILELQGQAKTEDDESKRRRL